MKQRLLKAIGLSPDNTLEIYELSTTFLTEKPKFLVFNVILNLKKQMKISSLLEYQQCAFELTLLILKNIS